MLRDIFENRRGIYQVDTDTGIFTLKDNTSTPKRFLGSLKPDWRLRTSGSYDLIEGRSKLEDINRQYRIFYVMSNLIYGNTFGFTPEFELGYIPFGIVCNPEDIAIVGKAELTFSDSFIERFNEPGLRMELGSRITKVHSQLTEEERDYAIRKH
ncbi:MAG: hypothetical protein Q8Q35_01270 [Nanoarchaeota archaeon]|nr:hypothetical protein [Nanoarchaeota archaeon]